METGLYKHYKGKTYRVHFVATHSETLEELVVYEALYDTAQKYWVRPLAMFNDTVSLDGREMSRFEKIGT